MQDKNFIKITFDESVLKPVSLRELCLQAKKEFDVFALNLKIELLPNVKVHLQDDMLNLSDLSGSKKIEHTIEFVLNSGSQFEYHMHLRSMQDFVPSTDMDCRLDKKLKFDFVGGQAFAKVRVSCLGLAQHKINFVTEQNHFVSKTSSCLCIKSVLLDSADLTCKNKIFIAAELNEVFARQINKNLLLGSEASVFSTPQLEVLSDNVKCKHGATVKTLDEEQLFYLHSRGIVKAQAEILLIHGFLY